jgi:CBS domain-containing protein
MQPGGKEVPKAPSGADALAALTIDALRQHPPFDEMDAESLRFLAGRLAIGYYPRGATLAGPQSGAADRLFILKQGRVRGSGGTPSGPAADRVLGAGECFPMGALIGRRATVYAYLAETDTFCWELPAADFHALLERSARFRAFCTGHLAMLVERSQRALRAEAGAALIDGAGMLAPLRGAVKRVPVSCAPQTPLREVLALMAKERIGSMVVVDAAQVPLGIFTNVDVLERVAAPQAPVDAPVSGVMTPRPIVLEEDATLADGAIAMARHGIRHIVVTRDGRLAGVVSERDLFALQRVSVRRTSERIRAAQRPADLVEAAQGVRGLARDLVAHGVAAEQLTAMVSALNDALSQKLIALAAEAHRLPGRWCWLALGSEGRMEQTLVTDQDNALIFVVEGDVEAARRTYLAFADEVNRGLAECGFPLCAGDIMARNPRWCLDAREWRAVFDDWIRNNDPEALLNASIFFDFRPLAGEAALAGELRDAVLAQTRANRAFQRAMAAVALKVEPPLGLLQDFSREEIDLKAFGARPMVDAARILALAQGHADTGTAPRLRAGGERLAADAFHFIQGLRLRHGNLVHVKALSAIDRRVLKESFRQAALLQSRVRMDFAL